MKLICGFYHRDGKPAVQVQLNAMVAAMIEPGLHPQVAQFVDGSVALAVLDFARTTPFELARDASGMVLAADYRLDEPESPTAGDEQKILAALQQNSAHGIARILGDFALAAWQPQTRTLICVRDSLGIRPFFTNNSDQTFAFASLPRALHAGGFASRKLDNDFLVAELLSISLSPERTLFCDISRLPPGHLQTITPAAKRTERYWQLDRSQAGSRRCTPQEAAEELSALITQAVRCRLPASGPVAAHLSGGLDSSAISILAARILRQQQRALLAYSFTASTAGIADERPYVEAALAQEQDIAWTPVSIANPAAFFKLKMDSDQLFQLDPAHPDVHICADAAQRNARMLLSGWGGDEGITFNGRGALAEALLSGHWRYLTQEIGALQHTRQWSLATVLRGEVLRYLLPEEIWEIAKRMAGKNTFSIPNETARLLRADPSQILQGKKRHLGSNAIENRYQLLSGQHLSRRTEHWALMGSRYGLAVGFPMLDRRVVEFALSLPSQLYLRGGWKRRVYRDAMAGVLPEKIRWRHDKLIPIPDMPALLGAQHEQLLPWLTELRKHPQVAGLLDLDIIERKLRGKITRAETPVLMRVLQAAAYLQQHH